MMIAACTHLRRLLGRKWMSFEKDSGFLNVN